MNGTSNVATILIVDDEYLTTEMLSTFLNIIGHSSREAFTAHQAWERLAFETPDAILLDIMLPDMNGLEMCRQLRQHYGAEELPILMISAIAPPRREEATACGANGYLEKPIRLADLRAALERVGITA